MGSNPLLGIILIICGQLFSSTLYVVEEYLIKKFNAPAIKVVGFEGLCGANIYLVLMFGLYYLRCDSWGTIKEELCLKDLEQDICRFENALLALKKLSSELKLLGCTSLFIVSITFFNFAGISITKYVSSVERTTVDKLRTCVI